MTSSPRFSGRRRRNPVHELYRNLGIALVVATTGVTGTVNVSAIERTLRQAVEPGVHVTLNWVREGGEVTFPARRPSTLVQIPNFGAERKRQFVLRVAGLRPFADLADPADPLDIPFPNELPPVAIGESTASEG
jgi:hypothetical protein